MEEKKFFDFKSEDSFNLNDEYNTMFGDDVFEASNPGEEKMMDAVMIIEELEKKYSEFTSINNYQNAFDNLNEFLSRFRTDSEEVKTMTKSDRDKLFGYGKELFKYYQDKYSSLNFNFEMTLKEWNYIENVLTKKMSYNGQELFNYWELYTKFIEPTKEITKNLPKQVESFIPVCSIQSLVLMSHLLMKHEEKGSTEQFHNFRTVLTEIAKMTRLFNAYGVMLERVTNKFNNWVNALNMMDGFNNEERINESTEK